MDGTTALSDVAAHYKKHGYVLLKNVFTLDEVLKLRERCAKVFKDADGKTGDLLTYDGLRDVVLDDRVLRLARAVLGDEIVYFGDSTFVADSRFDRHLHNDARGDKHDPSRSDFPIARFGVYLQDHSIHSDGLKIRPGSHKTVFWTPRNFARLFGVGGERLSPKAFVPRAFYNVPTEPGDLVFWSLRMHHSAHAVRLRVFDELALPTAIEPFVPSRLQRPGPGSRYALFFSLAAPGDHLRPYIKDLAYNPLYREFWKQCRFDAPDVVSLAAKKHVEVLADALALSKMS